jgi:hypothetical protein
VAAPFDDDLFLLIPKELFVNCLYCKLLKMVFYECVMTAKDTARKFDGGTSND